MKKRVIVRSKVGGSRAKNQEGSIIIFVALSIVVFLAFAALAVDWGHVLVTRNELQNISDAASLAATRQLGVIYEQLGQVPTDYTLTEPQVTQIVSAAQRVATENQAGRKYITINPEDIDIGKWTRDQITNEFGFSDNSVEPNAVRVKARRDDVANSPITTFFAKSFGKDSVNVTAFATASLSALSAIEPGNLIPVGISQQWFDQNFCDQPIRFYPTDSPEGCAGWNVFFGTKISDDDAACRGSGSASAQCLRDLILKRWLNDAQYKAPGATTGDIFEFTGGNLGESVFQAFLDLFNYMKTRDDEDPQDPNSWTAQVVVYKSPDCSNPTGPIEILGFATAKITNVLEPSNPLNPMFPPSWYIEAIVTCRDVAPGPGGGAEYGTMGSIPKLVE